jgi:hypothetical protein
MEQEKRLICEMIGARERVHGQFVVLEKRQGHVDVIMEHMKRAVRD